MGLKVGFETFSGGAWQMMALKDNNASHLKKVTVGTQDFIMEGTQKECVKWLKEFEKPVTCFEGFGHEVWMVLRGTAAKPAEELPIGTVVANHREPLKIRDPEIAQRVDSQRRRLIDPLEPL